MRSADFWVASIFTITLNACAAPEPEVYRGGVLVKKGPLSVENHYSFRFVDKWRISHSWLSGPVEIEPCRYPANSFQRLGGYGELGQEINPPFVETDSTLYVVSQDKGKWSLSGRREWVYGTDRDGRFVGFIAFCGHVFRDTYDGVGLYIVKPDHSKGTDEWIKDAQVITLNGLQWLRRTDPIQDWSHSRERGAAPIETWVLKIPDTQYWLKLHISSNSGATDSYHKGANAFPEKHQKIVDLFHEIVESVKLERITPIDISPLIKEVR